MYIKNLEAQAQRKLLYKNLDLTRTVRNPVDGQLYAPLTNMIKYSGNGVNGAKLRMLRVP